MIVRIFIALSFLLLLTACGGSEHKGHTGHQTPKTHLDTLNAYIDDAHNLVMPKMGKVRGAQKQAKYLLDSINLTLNKRSSMETQQEKSWKAALQSLIEELGYAEYEMDRWMTEFYEDTVKRNDEEKQLYLEAEKVKVDKVKEAILSSLTRADSLFATIH